MDFKTWYDEADMPTKDEFGWYDEETGIPFSKDYYEKVAAANKIKEKKDEEAQSTKNVKNSIRTQLSEIREKAYASLSQEDRDKLKELTRSLNEIKQVEDDMKMMKENPSLYYM